MSLRTTFVNADQADTQCVLRRQHALSRVSLRSSKATLFVWRNAVWRVRLVTTSVSLRRARRIASLAQHHARSKRNTGPKQTAKLEVNEPLAYLGAWLIAGRQLATRDEHSAFKPRHLQTREYAHLQNWLRRACSSRSPVQTHGYLAV